MKTKIKRTKKKSLLKRETPLTQKQYDKLFTPLYPVINTQHLTREEYCKKASDSPCGDCDGFQLCQQRYAVCNVFDQWCRQQDKAA